MATNCQFTLFSLLLCFCAVANASPTTAKAFYCRDPDTGTLYPVNSTWHSTSFCGSYSCKLRKKSQQNNSQLTPPQTDGNRAANNNEQPNPTPIENVRKNCSHSHRKEGDKSKLESLKDQKNENAYINVENFKSQHYKNIELGAFTPDGDRYLTEEEITALSLLLQTMKKSDLEAILEVYNLAQDIYKEIDKVTESPNQTQYSKEAVKELIEKNIPQLNFNEISKGTKPASYWYEPLAAVNSKAKALDLLISSQAHYVEQPVQAPKPEAPKPTPKAIYETTNLVKEPKTKQKIFDVTPKKNIERPFSEGTLSNKDFRQMPYYHAISNFIKEASYSRPVAYAPDGTHVSYLQSAAYPPSDVQALYPQAYNQPVYRPIAAYQQKDTMLSYPQQQREPIPDTNQQVYLQPQQQQNSEEQAGGPRHNGKPCCKNEPPLRLIPLPKIVRKTQETNYNTNKSFDGKASVLYSETNKINSQNLQFPISYLQNFTLPSIPNPDENSWALYNIKTQNREQPSYVGNIYEVSRDTILDSGLSSEVRDEDQQVVQNMKDSTQDLAEWQTAPLALSVLNEVKANIAKSKFLPFPYRKKVKLEKVGKLFSVDDSLRAKRHAAAEADRKERQLHADEYEVYLEKSTCQTDTEPGFFRIGNSSQPFPACCPQRIHS